MPTSSSDDDVINRDTAESEGDKGLDQKTAMLLYGLEYGSQLQQVVYPTRREMYFTTWAFGENRHAPPVPSPGPADAQDEFHEEADEAHNNKAQRSSGDNLQKLCRRTIGRRGG